MSEKSIWAEMAERWPSLVIARTEIERFTGGAIKEKYVANLDSAGKGPKGRIRIGRRIAYPIASLVEWMESRSTVVSAE